MGTGVSVGTNVAVSVGVTLGVSVGVSVTVGVLVGRTQSASGTSEHPRVASHSGLHGIPSPQVSTWHASEQPSQLLVPLSSQVSGYSTTPFPQPGHGIRQSPVSSVEHVSIGVGVAAGTTAPLAMVGVFRDGWMRVSARPCIVLADTFPLMVNCSRAGGANGESAAVSDGNGTGAKVEDTAVAEG